MCKEQGELREALQSAFAGSTDNNLKSNVGTEVASTSGYVDLQQPCEVQGWKLDELLALGIECLKQFTSEGRAEDLEQTKMIVVSYMRLVCKHRKQLDSRPDLMAAIGEFAVRFLHVLFQLTDYEGCISWFKKGMGREDALRASLEASGSVQFVVAVSFLKRTSFLKRAGGEPELGKLDMVDKGVQHLGRSCQLQVKDVGVLVAEMLIVEGLDVATCELALRLGRLQLVAGEMFEQLLGTPQRSTTEQAVELLDEVLRNVRGMMAEDLLVEAKDLLRMGLPFARNIEDMRTRDRYLESFEMELCEAYDSSHQIEKPLKIDKVCLFFQLQRSFVRL